MARNIPVPSVPYHLDTQKALSEHLFQSREAGFHHAPFEREMAFYESVRSGNLETVKTLFTPLGGEDFGTLSPDPIRNLQYHLVITIAMITRFCINGGMTPEEAYHRSDVYILQTDRCQTQEEIHQVHYQMAIEFTKRMRQLRTGQAYSKQVARMLDYISDHLHEQLLARDVAAHIQRTPSYTSQMFHKEVGIPMGQYIMQKKVEAAANMLQFSDYTALEISNYLCFSSQSYFIQQFKRYMGMTPREYRSRYYAVGWMHVLDEEKPEGAICSEPPKFSEKSENLV